MNFNLIQKGHNYGWPVISYGINYNGTTFTTLTEKEGMDQPVHYWVPSIAACGMTFIKGEQISRMGKTKSWLALCVSKYLNLCKVENGELRE